MNITIILSIILSVLLSATPIPIDFNTSYEKPAPKEVLISDIEYPTIQPYTYAKDEKKIDLTIPILIVLFILMMVGIGFIPRDEIEEEQIETSRPSDLRYAFEHKYLPVWLFDNPFNVMNFLLDYQEEGIYKWWNIMRNDLTTYNVLDERLYMKDVAVFYTVEENVGYMIVKMPRPKIKGDSYYLGLIVPQEKPLTETRYFTLEYENYEDGKSITNLFERTVNDKFINYGHLVEPRIDRFKDLLEQVYTKEYKFPKESLLKQKKGELGTGNI